MLKEAEVDLVVLDCFGYEMALLERARHHSGTSLCRRCDAQLMSRLRCSDEPSFERSDIDDLAVGAWILGTGGGVLISIT